MAQTQLTHSTYKFVQEKDADAVAWVFTDNKLTMQRLPFKLPDVKPDEARAKVTYTGLCHSDIHTAKDEWGDVVHPIAPGHEIVGIITEVGSNVTEFKVGDRVGFGAQRTCCDACEYCRINKEQYCTGDNDQLFTYGDKYWGGYASHIQHPAKFYFKLPDNLPENRVPPLFCAGATVYPPLAKFAKAGDEVAILGIGGLGHLAVQYAKAIGCKVTAFTSSNGKEDFIKRLGADRVVVNTPENLKQERGRFHFVLNTLPVASDMGELVKITRALGTFSQIGLPPTADLGKFDYSYIVFKEINFVGSLIGSRKDIRDMLEFSAKHNIVPLCEEFDFEDFPKAVDKLVNGKPIFRCVVDASKFEINRE